MGQKTTRGISRLVDFALARDKQRRRKNSRKENSVVDTEQIIATILKLSVKEKMIVSVQDKESDDIVPCACVIEKNAFSCGNSKTAAAKYEQLKHIFSSGEKMSSPILSIISHRDAAKKVSYCMFALHKDNEARWQRLSRRKSKKNLIDTVASLRLWLAYPFMRYVALPLAFRS